MVKQCPKLRNVIYGRPFIRLLNIFLMSTKKKLFVLVFSPEMQENGNGRKLKRSSKMALMLILRYSQYKEKNT